MEVCPRRYLSIEQLSLKSVLGSDLSPKTREQAVTHQLSSSPRRIICPEPRRAVWAPHIIGNVGRKCFSPKSNLPSDRGDSSLEILNMLLAKDESRDNSDDTSNRLGFYNCSPPVRTSNPLIHDIQFAQQRPPCPSPPKDSQAGSARSDRATSCGSTSFGGKPPVVRIEGFACSGSKSHCVVPAFG